MKFSEKRCLSRSVRIVLGSERSLSETQGDTIFPEDNSRIESPYYIRRNQSAMLSFVERVIPVLLSGVELGPSNRNQTIQLDEFSIFEDRSVETRTKLGRSSQ